jgi:hypothetical protein
MKRLNFVWLAAFAAIGILSSACGGETTPPPEETKAEEVQPAADAPAATEAPKFIAPIRGEAQLGYTTPDTNVVDKEVITTIRVKNLATTGAIAGLKIDEFWWDSSDNAVGGATARVRKPLGPGEVADIELRTAYIEDQAGSSKMSRNSYNFSHANGEINPVVLDEIEDPVTEEEDGADDSAESE